MTRSLVLMSLAAVAILTGGAVAQSPTVTQSPAVTPAPFHWHDDYTEYHLLDPATNQFHIVYFLNQRQAGLTYVLNQTRSGSAGSDISVTDPRTGAPLKFDYMTGKELAAAGVPGRLSPEEHYIRAHLARPVPEGGEGRVRIEKTYKDEKSYFATGDTITFARSLGIGRNAIVLPADYGLVSSNVAAHIDSLNDGRVRVSFENINGYASDVSIRAAKRAAHPATPRISRARAAEFTKSLYELQPDGSVRVTREELRGQIGSNFHVSYFDQLAGAVVFDMDIGAVLRVEREKGNAVFAIPAVPLTARTTARLRITGSLRGFNSGWTAETNGLSWRHEIREPRATIVLPPGYELTVAANPVTLGTLPDGRQYLQVVNNRQEPFALMLHAAKVR